MNRIIVSIIILAVMTVGCIVSVWYINNFTGRLYDLVEITEKAFSENDTEKSVEYASELKQSWDDFLKFGILVNDLGQAIEITSGIAEIESFAKEEDDEIYAACDRVKSQIELFRGIQTPTFWKIL